MKKILDEKCLFIARLCLKMSRLRSEYDFEPCVIKKGETLGKIKYTCISNKMTNYGKHLQNTQLFLRKYDGFKVIEIHFYDILQQSGDILIDNNKHQVLKPTVNKTLQM